MTVRPVNLSKDWPVLEAFWRQKGYPQVDRSYLPPTGRVVVDSVGTLLCGGFLVKSDTSVATLAFVCGNPNISPDQRSEALDTLILELVELGIFLGFKVVGSATNIPALQARYERLGFAITDKNVKCYGGYV